MQRATIEKMLNSVDIRINGTRAWDMQVHREQLFQRIARRGSLGLGEAYMDGWWDCEALDEAICRILRGRLDRRFRLTLPDMLAAVAFAVRNLQSVARSTLVAERHYDFSNEMFAAMLGPTMQYSCGYWEGARNLDEAQEAKMDLICRKLHLEEGMRVLDIGCGWGGLGRYMAERYKVRFSGVTVSKEQLRYAEEHSRGLNLRWRLEDYRSLREKYDRIVSVGMFEHVGYKNYATFMRTVRGLLEADGLFLLHTIGTNQESRSGDPWIEKYIFPNGMLPSIADIGRAIARRFVMEDWHNFGAYYDRTLMAWARNFRRGREEGRFRCEERIARMFRYYLLSCAGLFRARSTQLWQLVLSPKGLMGGYCRPAR